MRDRIWHVAGLDQSITYLMTVYINMFRWNHHVSVPIQIILKGSWTFSIIGSKWMSRELHGNMLKVRALVLLNNFCSGHLLFPTCIPSVLGNRLLIRYLSCYDMPIYNSFIFCDLWASLSILHAFPFNMAAQNENDHLFIWHHYFTTFLLSNTFPAAFFQSFPQWISDPWVQDYSFHCPHSSFSHIIMVDGWCIYIAFCWYLANLNYSELIQLW